MSSKISSRLIQEKLITEENLQDAHTRRVVRGGTLGTILLERNLIKEDKLIHILAQELECNPLIPSHLDEIDKKLSKTISEKDASALHVAPIKIHDQQLTLWIGELTDKKELEKFAFDLGLKLCLFAANDLRLEQARSLLYEKEPSERYTLLLKTHGQKPPYYVMNSADSETQKMQIEGETVKVKKPVFSNNTEDQEIVSRQRRDTVKDIDEARIETAPNQVVQPGETLVDTPIEPNQNPVLPNTPTLVSPENEIDLARKSTDEVPSLNELERKQSLKDKIATIASNFDDTDQSSPAENDESTQSVKSLPLDDALLDITNAKTRDDLLLAVLKGARHQLKAVDLFTYGGKGEPLLGRFSFRETFDDLEIRGRKISLRLPSVVKRAAEDGTIYLGPAPDNDATATVLLDADVLSPHLAIAPIQLRGKTVCVLIGYDPDGPIPITLRGPLNTLIDAAAKALIKIILKRKTNEQKPLQTQDTPKDQPAPSDPIVQHTPTLIEDQRSLERDEDNRPVNAHGEIPKQRQSTPAVEPLEEKVIIDFGDNLSSQSISKILKDLDEELLDRKSALEEINKRGRSAIGEILEHFPGRLKFSRAETTELPIVSDCSVVLFLLKEIGRPIIGSLAPLLMQGDDDTRFYATYLLSELTYPESVSLLSERLHDVDPSVRQAAAYGLRRCKELEEYERILKDLREDLGHPNARPRRAAMRALGALGDTLATPSLIAQLRDEDQETAQIAYQSLVMLTKDDHGMSPNDWRIWWDSNRNRDRIEWLIDGLVHDDAEIRLTSSIELVEITGIAFDYTPSLTPAEREEIRRRYMLWWRDQGPNT